MCSSDLCEVQLQHGYFMERFHRFMYLLWVILGSSPTSSALKYTLYFHNSQHVYPDKEDDALLALEKKIKKHPTLVNILQSCIIDIDTNETLIKTNTNKRFQKIYVCKNKLKLF